MNQTASGIGLAIAHALAANGCNIVVNSFSDTDEDHAIAAEIEKQHGVKAAYIQADMSKGYDCRALMKKSGWGRIVNIASAHGLRASPCKSAYVSAKHGLVGLTKTVAQEMAEARVNVTCNAICPGYVHTPLVENQIADQMKAHKMSRDEVIDKVILDRQPTRQFATVEEIGGIAVFLTTPAADQVTGAAIPVDGGWTAA